MGWLSSLLGRKKCAVCGETISTREPRGMIQGINIVVEAPPTSKDSQAATYCRKCKQTMHIHCCIVAPYAPGMSDYKRVLCPKCGEEIQML